jgi:acetolactate synthase I/III small subunit
MQQILVATLDDEPGVLDRVASLFRRRAFNIHSLTVSPSEEEGSSRLTVVVDTDEQGLCRARASLEKLINVRSVRRHESRSSVIRDLALVRVQTTEHARADVMQVAQIFRAQVVDLTLNSIVLECTGGIEKLDRFVEVLRPYGLLELHRSGAVAMGRGASEVAENEYVAAGASLAASV